MPVISHPQLALLPGRPRAGRLRWRRKRTHISDQPFSILWDPGAVSRDDAIFSSDTISSDESLLLDVNFHSKISRRPKISRRLTVPGSPRMTFQLQVSSARAVGKLLEPTVREHDQQFPTQIQDGGRWVLSMNVLKMLFAKGCIIYSVFFKVKLGRSISPFMLFLSNTIPASCTEKGWKMYHVTVLLGPSSGAFLSKSFRQYLYA